MPTQPLTPKRLVTLVAGLFILVGMSWYRLTQPLPAEWNVIQGETMGTTYTVKFHGARDRSLTQAIERALEDVNAGMSTYREDSELSKFNAAGTDSVQLSAPVFQIMTDAIELSRETNGAFDITVGPIVNAYGFGPDTLIKLPTNSELDALRDRVGYTLLSLDKTTSTIRKSVAEVYCDLSAIAKGYGVDAVVNALEANEINNYFVEIGGEVRCLGTNPDGIAWRIGIEKPIVNAREVHRVVSLQSGAMATSGSYRNYIEAGGNRISHTIDPRTGRPITHNVVSVSIIHQSCEWADGYATALLVMGEEEGLAFAETRQLAVLILIQQDDGTLREVISSEFEKYLPTGETN